MSPSSSTNIPLPASHHHHLHHHLLPISIPLPNMDHAITSSSVSSPSAPDDNTAAEVDHLLEGIDRVRIDDLWTTPRASHLVTRDPSPFRAGLFAPPTNKGAIAAIAPPPSFHHHTPHHHNLNNSYFHHPSHHLTTTCINNTTTNINTTTTNPPPPPPPPPPLSQSLTRSNTLPCSTTNTNPNPVDHFPDLFKVYPCQTRQACIAAEDTAECFFYHSTRTDRRRPNVAIYKPHMCRFIDDPAGCRKADRCPFSHNDFERRYHPDRFGKETCRDFLRGDCPRRYCTFRHQVSTKVEIALAQIDLMNDKELLQMVLKISQPKGKALCEKLLRRFGHGKKHSGWKLQGFNPHGRDDQKVKFVTVRVEHVKKTLKLSGEKKWSATLKTSSLRDMMSGVRKVAEEIRERCRAQQSYVEAPNCEIHRLIRAVFSNTNWSCHSQEGDNPFLVTPDNQNDALTALERLVDLIVASVGNLDGGASMNASDENKHIHVNKLPSPNHPPVVSLGGKQYSTGSIRKNTSNNNSLGENGSLVVGSVDKPPLARKTSDICALWGRSDINWAGK